MTDLRADIARRFFDSIERGDVDGVVACYVADPQIWHNTDNRVMTLAEQVAGLHAFIAKYPERRYLERRVGLFEGGFVQQHVFRGRGPDGQEVSYPGCVVARLDGDRIGRIDEYLDSARGASGG